MQNHNESHPSNRNTRTEVQSIMTEKKTRGNPKLRRGVQIAGAVILLTVAIGICAASMLYAIQIMERGVKTSRLLNEALSSAMVGPAFASPWFAFGIMLLTRSLCTKGLVGKPTEDIVRRDLRMCIWAKTPFFFLMFVSYTFFYIRYASQVKMWVLIPTVVAGVFMIWFLCIALRRIAQVNRGEWELCEAELISKEYTGDTSMEQIYGHSYVLVFTSNGRIWQKNVSSGYCGKARTGNSYWAVHMPGRERPMLSYNIYGDASW